ncbi:MAG TPA: cysteine hydrolase [Acidimicrobiales bacterium]|nr:cysteine hydrolase [Acidimicrobiales bacterium]
MPADLSSLVAPWRTAVVTAGVQKGIVGDGSAVPTPGRAASAAMLARLLHLVDAARAAGAEVVHGTYVQRADGKGSNHNARLFAGPGGSPTALVAGSVAAQLAGEVGAASTDVVVTRSQGLNPMAGTELDAVLRHLGVTTIVAAGASVNVAVTNLVMDAVNRGYDVVLPRDAVCGAPARYVEDVIDNTLSLLATVTTVDEIVARWND